MNKKRHSPLWQSTVMLSLVDAKYQNKPFILNVIMLSVRVHYHLKKVTQLLPFGTRSQGIMTLGFGWDLVTTD